MPERIGRYEIEKELGQGGMAVVYLARDPLMDRQVAIKVLPRQFTFDPGFRERFRREARLLARLQHPAIVPVYDFGEEDDQLYLVMAFMRGGSLQDRLRHGPLPLAECARILSWLAPGLDAAHERGMIHRDLKPANILFDEWDKPYLADFGITKLIAGGDTALTATGGLVGTPAYMSPEQALATRDLDGRSDLYSMGVIFFQMVTGRTPFMADTPLGMALKHVSEPVPQVAADNPALPAATQKIVERAMAKEPDNRYGKAGDLAAAAQGLAGQPATAGAGQKLGRVGWLIPAAGGALLLFLAVAVLVVIGLRGLLAGSEDRQTAGLTATGTLTPTPSPLPTRPPTATPPPDLSIPPPNAGLGDTWTRPQDGMVIVYVPAGVFLMGSPTGDPDADDDEFPQHEVSLDAFWLDRTEVTNGQYEVCVADGNCGAFEDFGSDFNGDNQPVVGVSWQDATDFCTWAGGQLPTEAQAEFAARGPENLKYPWGNSFDGRQVNFCDVNCSYDWRDVKYDDGYEFNAPVGSYPAGASWVGALDITGNVWEWVADWYSGDYYDSSPRVNPINLASGDRKVLRGGSWYDSGQFVRGANRGSYPFADRSDNLGFRCSQPQA